MSCGGRAVRTATVDLSGQAVVQGTVVRDGQPVVGAYVRLLDGLGEFTAEVTSGASGEFRFFAVSGEWTVRVLAPHSSSVESKVSASTGAVTEVALSL